jgi:uncharacterized membrane protein HdeD (DUF308 family)
MTAYGRWREVTDTALALPNALPREEARMLTEERLIIREGARYWWLFLVSGVLWLLIAWMVLRLNATSIATVGVLLGVVFLIAGINEVGMASLAPGGWKVWHYIMAVIFLLGGLWGFIRPVNTFFALASVLGLILVFYGSFEIIQGAASRAVNPYWWLKLITGILLVLLAFWVSGSDRLYALAQRTYLILFWVGFLALFRGFSQIMLAFTIRHAGQEAAPIGPAGPRVGGSP